jgi:undecaprenol kinase
MDLNDNKRKYRYIETFKFAFEGIRTAFIQEKNLRFHTFFSVFVILLASFLSLTVLEWILILIAIGGMLVLELINSAIERVVDLITTDYHPLAKQAKDIAAGAVLIYALLSIVIGILILLPKLVKII